MHNCDGNRADQNRLGFKLWRGLSIDNRIHRQLNNVLSLIFNKISKYPCHLSRLNCPSIYNFQFKQLISAHYFFTQGLEELKVRRAILEGKEK